MFNVEFLHVIREFEYRLVLERLQPGARILEIGGGTGYQAKRLAGDGFQVESIDVPDSNYAGQLEYPVRQYDGRNIPFGDASFDIVFSSNVLEHVRDLHFLQGEIRRVLRPGGYCVHLMPSGAWRFWTNVAHYVELVQRLAMLAPRLLPRGISRQALGDAFAVLRLAAGTARGYAIVPRHGEAGNAITEIATFGARHWKRHFEREGYALREVAPTGLFYTGHMVFGNRLSLGARQRLASRMGSACVIYVAEPAVRAAG